MFDIMKHISSRNLRLCDDIYIGIYTESFKNTHSYLLHFLLQNTCVLNNKYYLFCYEKQSTMLCH